MHTVRATNRQLTQVSASTVAVAARERGVADAEAALQQLQLQVLVQYQTMLALHEELQARWGAGLHHMREAQGAAMQRLPMPGCSACAREMGGSAAT